MKVLTVRQPWAWALIHGGKDVENRSWLTSYRGPVAIHAGKAIDPAGFHDQNLMDAGGWHARIHTGVILGVVHLVDAHEQTPGCCTSKWAQPHQAHLAVANPRPLAEPIPMRGALGLRDLPRDLTHLVDTQLQVSR